MEINDDPGYGIPLSMGLNDETFGGASNRAPGDGVHETPSPGLAFAIMFGCAFQEAGVIPTVGQLTGTVLDFLNENGYGPGFLSSGDAVTMINGEPHVMSIDEAFGTDHGMYAIIEPSLDDAIIHMVAPEALANDPLALAIMDGSFKTTE